MNRHTVFVAGKHFVLLSEEKDDYVQKLAREVGATINTIIEKNPTLDRRGAAILCALDYADDKNKETERCNSLVEKTQPLIAQADRQAKQLKELKEKSFRQDDEIRSLKEQLKKKDKELRSLTDQKRHLEKKLSERAAAQKPVNAQKPESKPAQAKGYTPTRQISLFDNEKN